MKSKGKFLIIIFIFIVAIFGIGALMKGKKTSDTTSKPTIKIKAMSKTLNPDEKTGGTEGYIEYLDGETLGTNIDISVTWENGIGFKSNGIKGLLFKRKVGSNVVQTLLTSKAEHLKDEAEGTVTLKGDNILDGYRGSETVGQNTITIEYITNEIPTNMTPETSNPDMSTFNPVEFDGVYANFTIEQNDLDTTVNIDQVVVLDIPITMDSDQLKTSLTNTGYTLYEIKSVNGNYTTTVRLVKVDDKYVKPVDPNTGAVISSIGEFKFEKYLLSNFISNREGEYLNTKDTHNIEYITKDKLQSSVYVMNNSMFDIIEKSKTHPLSGDVIINVSYPNFYLDASVAKSDYNKVGIIDLTPGKTQSSKNMIWKLKPVTNKANTYNVFSPITNMAWTYAGDGYSSYSSNPTSQYDILFEKFGDYYMFSLVDAQGTKIKFRYYQNGMLHATVSDTPDSDFKKNAIFKVPDNTYLQPYNEGTVRTHGDYQGGIIVESLDDCKSGCDADVRCTSFTYNDKDKQCWFKGTVPDKTQQVATTSGWTNWKHLVKIPPGYGIVGIGDSFQGDIRNVSGLQLHECAKECDGDVDCVAFVHGFHNNKPHCWLKNDQVSGSIADNTDDPQRQIFYKMDKSGKSHVILDVYDVANYDSDMIQSDQGKSDIVGGADVNHITRLRKCREFAKSRGSASFGIRTMEPDDNWKNTCFVPKSYIYPSQHKLLNSNKYNFYCTDENANADSLCDVEKSKTVVVNPKFTSATEIADIGYWSKTTGWEIKHSSRFDASTHDASWFHGWYAFNHLAAWVNNPQETGASNNGWHSQSSTNDEWISIKYPKKVRLDKYIIQVRHWEDYAWMWWPIKWIIQGSDDGSKWNDIETRTLAKSDYWKKYSEIRLFNIRDKNIPRYQYFRLVIPPDGRIRNNQTPTSNEAAFISNWQLFTDVGE
jgi:hypothetical protein